MSNQIQDDKCRNVSSMTTEGIRKMLLRQKMTLRQHVKKSSSQATETVTPLYVYVGYRYSLLNTSFLSFPIYNKSVTDWHYHILLNQNNFTNQELIFLFSLK